MPVYIADAGPNEIVIYVDPGRDTPATEHSRFSHHGDPDDALAINRWYRLRAWRKPHDGGGHQVAQVVPFDTSTEGKL